MGGSARCAAHRLASASGSTRHRATVLCSLLLPRNVYYLETNRPPAYSAHRRCFIVLPEAHPRKYPLPLPDMFQNLFKTNSLGCADSHRGDALIACLEQTKPRAEVDLCAVHGPWAVGLV